MPIYEYGCPDCEHRFERMQSITAKAVRTCPACGKRKVARLISSTSFILKGGGWYADGYDKKPASKTAESSSTPAKSDGASKSDGGSDSKSASSSKGDSGSKSTKPAAKSSGKSAAA